MPQRRLLRIPPALAILGIPIHLHRNWYPAQQLEKRNPGQNSFLAGVKK
jgi:hypothetical protein